MTEITAEEALAALKDPIKGSLRVLKALQKQMDLYTEQINEGKRQLVAENDFEQVAAETVIQNITEMAELDGDDPPRITIVPSISTGWKKPR